MSRRTCISIDLKSYFASVECANRGLDPLDTLLVVANPTRTEKTICLAVTPALRNLGVPGRARLFEVGRMVSRLNAQRGCGKDAKGSHSKAELDRDPTLAIDYLTVAPRMDCYLATSRKIRGIYLKSIAPEDLFAYSIDEVFIDATAYLASHGGTARELAAGLIREVLRETGITATAGIGPNLFLCKVAMDILAKRMEAGADGVRIAELDEATFRRNFWNHRPLTDFWMVGRATAQRLAEMGIYTLGQLADFSRTHAEALRRRFGANAATLINHAWGLEPETVEDWLARTPAQRSLSSGHVLGVPVSFAQAKSIALELAEGVSLELVRKGVRAAQIALTVDYDRENVEDANRPVRYTGQLKKDAYGRLVPKPSHGSFNFKVPTASGAELKAGVAEILDRCVDRLLSVKRVTVTANGLVDAAAPATPAEVVQTDLFADKGSRDEAHRKALAREKEVRLQETMARLADRFGREVVHRGSNHLGKQRHGGITPDPRQPPDGGDTNLRE